MKKSITIALTLLVLLLIGPQSAHIGIANAQSPDPAMDTETIIRTHYDLVEAGEIDAAMEYLHENIVSVVLPPPPGTDPASVGADLYRATIEYLVSDSIDYEFTNVSVQGGTLTFSAEVHTDLFRSVGVSPIKFTGSAVVQEGLMISETWVMDPHDDTRLSAAIAQANNKASLMRAYEEVFNQGNFDSLENDISPNAIDHSSPDLQGIDAFKIPMMGLREAIPDINATPDIIIAEGDIVIALTTFTGTHQGEFLGIPPSGEEITWSHVDINRFEDGQVVEAWHIGTEAMLQAMGFEMVPSAD